MLLLLDSESVYVELERLWCVTREKLEMGVPCPLDPDCEGENVAVVREDCTLVGDLSADAGEEVVGVLSDRFRFDRFALEMDREREGFRRADEIGTSAFEVDVGVMSSLCSSELFSSPLTTWLYLCLLMGIVVENPSADDFPDGCCRC